MCKIHHIFYPFSHQTTRTFLEYFTLKPHYTPGFSLLISHNISRVFSHWVLSKLKWERKIDPMNKANICSNKMIMGNIFAKLSPPQRKRENWESYSLEDFWQTPLLQFPTTFYLHSLFHRTFTINCFWWSHFLQVEHIYIVIVKQ